MNDIDKRLAEIRRTLNNFYNKPDWHFSIDAREAINYLLDLAESRGRELAAWRQAAEEQKSLYPTEVFPVDGLSQDCRSAAMARLTCDLIIARQRQLAEEGEQT